jgi:hypothetical protein
MYFKKYEFVKEKIEGYNLFKIIDSRRSAIFANEVFVESVEKQGITGFKFELVWPAESVPLNHEKKQATSAMKKAKLKAKVTPVEASFMNELLKARHRAYALVGASENDSPSKIVELIEIYVEKLLSAGKMQTGDYEMESIAMSLAAAWGLSVCEEYNWEWKDLEVAGKIRKGYYILSPDHGYCCQPFYFIAKILRGENIGPDGNNDNTVQLLFNMIKTIADRHTAEKYTVIA